MEGKSFSNVKFSPHRELPHVIMYSQSIRLSLYMHTPLSVRNSSSERGNREIEAGVRGAKHGQIPFPSLLLRLFVAHNRLRVWI